MKLQHLLLSTCVLKYSTFATACLLFFSSAVAQTGTVTLSGTVKDTTGAIIPGVRIQVINNDTSISITTTTNGAGVYVASALKPGIYHIVADKTGFKREEMNNLRLNVGDALNQDLTMQVGTVSESVTVLAESEHVNATDATVGTVVERRVVEDMPLNGRSFQSLITLTPGVATVAAGNNTPGQFVVNGQRTDTSYFYCRRR